MDAVPKSPYEKVGGMMFFARTLDKIRLHAAGKLRSDFHANLGVGPGDKWCTGFLHINYEDLKARVLAGGTDEEILQWCQEKGRVLNDTDLFVWNHFVSKLGWNDVASARLEKYKQENGLGHRADILTIPEFMEVDEGRKA